MTEQLSGFALTTISAEVGELVAAGPYGGIQLHHDDYLPPVPQHADGDT